MVANYDRFSHRLRFPRLPRPIELAVSPLLSNFWLVCTQAGPFAITDKPNFEELAVETSSLIVDVPEFRNTDVHLLQPGVFPQFSKFLVIDEWTYLFALEGPLELAKQSALKVEDHARDRPSKTFFEAVESNALGFFMYVDGFWEAYLRDQSSIPNLIGQGFTEIDSDHWLNDHGSQR